MRDLVIIAGEFPEQADKTETPDLDADLRAYTDKGFLNVSDLPEGLERLLTVGAGTVLATGGAPLDIVVLGGYGAHLWKNWNPEHTTRLMAKSRRKLLNLMQTEDYRLAGMLWLGQSHPETETNKNRELFTKLVQRFRIMLGAPQLPVAATVEGPSADAYVDALGLPNYVSLPRSADTAPPRLQTAAALAHALQDATKESTWATNCTRRWLWKGNMYEAWLSRHAEQEDNHYIVVFPPAEPEISGFEIAAFGQDALEKRGAQAIFIRSRQSNWFQDRETEDLCAAIRAAIPEDARVTLYGASMGAYGALLCAGLLRAERVVAVSPQYSIDPKVVPFERRWREHSDRIGRFRYDLNAMMARDAQKHVFYDTLHPDRRHIDLFERDENFRAHCLPGASHHILRYFKETGTIDTFLSVLMDPDADFEDLIRKARRQRQNSTIYWLTIFRQFKFTRPGLAATAIERCIEIDGPRPKYLNKLKKLDPEVVRNHSVNAAHAARRKKLKSY
ncbi:hypothetical protein [Roseovarius sp. 2305UL8-3]|uniref:hypothetical protein n=1 Tax=Roseovarius conchicola TaxID=3121636 RepID=UPI0035290D9B